MTGDSSGICGLGVLARFNRSTAWRVLAGDENFSDERIIGRDSREVQAAGEGTAADQRTSRSAHSPLTMAGHAFLRVDGSALRGRATGAEQFWTHRAPLRAPPASVERCRPRPSHGPLRPLPNRTKQAE